jgi:hypothetical protein
VSRYSRFGSSTPNSLSTAPWLRARTVVLHPRSVASVVWFFEGLKPTPPPTLLLPQDLCPDATVVGSKVCLQFLANLVHKPFNQLLVKNEDKLDLGGTHPPSVAVTLCPYPPQLPPPRSHPDAADGVSDAKVANRAIREWHGARSSPQRPVCFAFDISACAGGHELTFIMAPNLHWPDTIFTHDAATNHLYTCDAFGMHYCTEEAFDPPEDKVGDAESSLGDAASSLGDTKSSLGGRLELAG